MLDTKSLDELAAKLNNAIPEPLRNIQQEFEKTLHAGLQSSLQRLNLVTQEEFEVQTQLLSRTREKLDTLEQRLQELEAQLSTRSSERKPTEKAQTDKHHTHQNQPSSQEDIKPD